MDMWVELLLSDRCFRGTHLRAHAHRQRVAHLRTKAFCGDEDRLSSERPDPGDLQPLRLHLPRERVDDFGVGASLDSDGLCVGFGGETGGLGLCSCFDFETFSLGFGSGNDAVGLGFCLSL